MSLSSPGKAAPTQGTVEPVRVTGGAGGDFDIGATLVGQLGLACWTEGLFWDDRKEWTFAEFPLAYLKGARAKLSFLLLGDGAPDIDLAAWKGPEIGLGKAPDLE